MVMLASRSIGPSGRAASPTGPRVSREVREIMRSGGAGGWGRGEERWIASSAMSGLRGKVGFDLVGEKQVVNAAVQCLEFGRADRGEAEIVRVELGLHPAGMRREHQDPAADEQRLLDRVGDENHREAA